MKKGIAAVLMLSLIMTATGCSPSSDQASSSDGKLSVATSFYPLEEMATRIGGDAVNVTNLTPIGSEPHDMELNPDQMIQLQDAGLVLYVGDGFTPSVESAVANRSSDSVDVIKGLALDASAGDSHAHEGHDSHDHSNETDSKDPHFWLNPVLLSQASQTVERALVERLPGHADTIRTNAELYRSELTQLDSDYRQQLASCKSKKIVTSHAAFHYLAKQYGLEQVPVALSPDAEPDPQTLDRVVKEIEANNITTVFSETLASPRVAETLAREAGVKTAVLNPIEGLTQDEAKSGADYDLIMRENLKALRDALDCH